MWICSHVGPVLAVMIWTRALEQPCANDETAWHVLSLQSHHCFGSEQSRRDCLVGMKPKHLYFNYSAYSFQTASFWVFFYGHVTEELVEF